LDSRLLIHYFACFFQHVSFIKAIRVKLDYQSNMTIGIVGAGNVGGTLGRVWAKLGHQVVFGSRDTNAEDLKQLVASSGGPARAASLKEAAQAAEVIALATPWPVTQEVLKGLGDLNGKILIDATNPLTRNFELEYGATASGGEKVAEWARGAQVVKAFNTVGFNIMAAPSFGTDRAVMFYCGDDGGARQTVRTLVEELGFEAVDAGPLRQARVLEPIALLWISLAMAQGLGREFAFKLMRH
jgi:predicted dinucleotide-binding enzyme